jgi:Flp pilus assembly protein TadB
MGWILLEALVALLLAIGIVWWTMGPKRKKRLPGDRDDRPGR